MAPATPVLIFSQQSGRPVSKGCWVCGLLEPADRLPSADGTLRGQPWTETLIPDEIFLVEKSSKGGYMIILPPMRSRLWKILGSSSGKGGFQNPGIDLHPFGVRQGTTFIDDHTIPRTPCTCFPPASLAVPKNLFWLVLLASIVIPVIAAETSSLYVDAAAWAFGIMANVPSIYVLANLSLSSSGNDNTENTIWKVARGWSVSFGPVFALVLVTLLGAKLLREKRKAFVILLFVMITLGLLILMLFTREEGWNALDLLSICVSWCAVVSYIIVDEPGVISAAVTSYGLQAERSQQSLSGPNKGGEHGHSRLEAGRVFLQSDGIFTIGDDSTLDERASRADV